MADLAARLAEALPSDVLMHATGRDVIKTKCEGMSVDGAEMRRRLVEGMLRAAPDLVAAWELGHRLMDENDALLAEACGQVRVISLDRIWPAVTNELRTALLRLAKEG